MSRLTGKEVTIGYGDRVIVDNLDVAIPDGAITSIIGPNGCGKSTLLKAL
ncbi:iron-enterobactin transporter ATP-binding protein, partial [Staphylococcus pseudintermedius]